MKCRANLRRLGQPKDCRKRVHLLWWDLAAARPHPTIEIACKMKCRWGLHKEKHSTKDTFELAPDPSGVPSECWPLPWAPYLVKRQRLCIFGAESSAKGHETLRHSVIDMGD